MFVKFRHIPLRIEREAFSGFIAVVRQFGLNQHADLICRLKILRHFTVCVQTGEIEPSRTSLLQMGSVDGSIRRCHSSKRIYMIIAKSTQEYGLAVKAKLLTCNLKFPDAKPFMPHVNCTPVPDNLHFRRVEIWMFRRPRTKTVQRKSQYGFADGTLCLNRLSLHRKANLAGVHSAHSHVRLCSFGVEIASHPSVVDKRLRSSLKFDIAVNAAPPMHGTHETFARRTPIVDLNYDSRFFSRLDQISDLILVRAAVVINKRDLFAVHPYPANRFNASKLYPDALSCPSGRDIHALSIPHEAHVLVTDRL